MTGDTLDQSAGRPLQPGPERRPSVLRRIRRSTGRILSVALMAAMIGLAVLFAVGAAHGYEAFIVLSGSMGRAAPTGSLVVGRPLPPDRIAVGDMILLRDSEHGMPVLHRVIERTERGSDIVVRTKGDANPAPDAEPYTLGPTNITPLLVIPRLGYVLAFVRTPLGWMVVALAAFLVIGLVAVRRRAGSKPEPRHPR
jgi:signal peptidase I